MYYRQGDQIVRPTFTPRKPVIENFEQGNNGFPIWLIILIVAVIVIIAACLIWWLTRPKGESYKSY